MAPLNKPAEMGSPGKLVSAVRRLEDAKHVMDELPDAATAECPEVGFRV